VRWAARASKNREDGDAALEQPPARDRPGSGEDSASIAPVTLLAGRAWPGDPEISGATKKDFETFNLKAR
jgi:hypothetical protein